MLLVYTVVAILAVASVQSQQPANERPRFAQDQYKQSQRQRAGSLVESLQYGTGFYRERFEGQSFCRKINKCCESRDDDCSVEIGETRCYCDLFCDQGREDPWNRQAPDCCPDYPQFCKNESRPNPVPQPGCRDYQFECHSDRKCIDGRYRCDGIQNCIDGSDENGCPSTGCRDGEFVCESDQSCVSRSYVCDGYDHCPDRSDERDCDSFGITLRPDIIYLSDSHPGGQVEFTCEFRSRHDLHLELRSDPPVNFRESNQPRTYFTTGQEVQRLPIRPNIRGIVCEAFDRSGYKVLSATAVVYPDRGGLGPGPFPIVDPTPAPRPPQPRRPEPAQPACTQTEVFSRCGHLNTKMTDLMQSLVPDRDQLCCIFNEQVTCYQSLNCPGIIEAFSGPAEAQIRNACPNYVYTPGCADSGAAPRLTGPQLGLLPPNYAKCVDITNATPDTIIVSVTYRDEQGEREKSSAIDGAGEYQFPEEQRSSGSYRTAIPLHTISVLARNTNDKVSEIVTVSGVQGCIARTISYNPSSDGYQITG